MHKRSMFLTGGLALAAALAGFSTNTTTPNTTNVAARVRQLTGSVPPGGEVRPTKEAPVKPATQADSKLELAYQLRPLVELGTQLRFPQRPVRRRVKYGRHRWVVLG